MFGCVFFFFSSRRRHTRYWRDWSSDVCSSDLIQGILPLQTNTLAFPLHLHLPHLSWSSSPPLALPFKLQCFSQNMPIIPSQHMLVPSHSIRLCHLNHHLFQSQPHIAFTIALSVFLKIAISFSLKHHVSLPYNITDLTQL